MNRILATIASGLLLVWATSVPVALAAADTTAQAQAQEGKAEPEAKAEPAAKADNQAKGESGAEAKAKAADERPAPVPGVLRPLGVTEPDSGPPTSDHPPSRQGAESAHDHGHNDPSDLSHGDGGPALHQPQEWRFDLSIFTFVIFGLLLLILTKFAWGPIAAGLEKREQTIAKQIADAEHASAMAAKQLQEYERKLAAATEEARAIVTQARQDAVSAKDKIVAEAQAVAAKERDRAVSDITAAKNQALQEIAEQSVSTAISLASNIIRREVKPADHDKLISESLQKFSNLN